jgi:hypothetical protein
MALVRLYLNYPNYQICVYKGAAMILAHHICLYLSISPMEDRHAICKFSTRSSPHEHFSKVKFIAYLHTTRQLLKPFLAPKPLDWILVLMNKENWHVLDTDAANSRRLQFGCPPTEKTQNFSIPMYNCCHTLRNKSNC